MATNITDLRAKGFMRNTSPELNQLLGNDDTRICKVETINDKQFKALLWNCGAWQLTDKETLFRGLEKQPQSEPML